jgi:hypothetical protein
MPTILQLPSAGALSGTEAVPIVQGGVTVQATAGAISGVGGGVGPEIAYTSPSGTIDPAITGFTAGVGIAGTGRVRVTLAANTTWQGLPAGADGQTLVLMVVAGNFTLTLAALDASTLLQEIMASGSTVPLALYDAVELVYSASLGNWVLII